MCWPQQLAAGFAHGRVPRDFITSCGPLAAAGNYTGSGCCCPCHHLSSQGQKSLQPGGCLFPDSPVHSGQPPLSLQTQMRAVTPTSPAQHCFPVCTTSSLFPGSPFRAHPSHPHCRHSCGVGLTAHKYLKADTAAKSCRLTAQACHGNWSHSTHSNRGYGAEEILDLREEHRIH